MPGFHTDFETGLMDDFDFTIDRAFFAPDAKYNNGDTMLLQLEGTTDDLDNPTTHVWFPVGKGWQTKDGGESIVHESGKADKYFVGTSLMAKLLARCVNDFDMEDLLNKRGTPFEAKVWVGLKFHMKSETVDFGAGGNLTPRAKVLPIKFLGVDEGISSGGGSEAKAEAAPSTPVAPTETAKEKMVRLQAEKAAASSNGNGSGSLRDTVLETLKGHTEFIAGQNAALELPGVQDDDTILNDLMDESGLWAEAHA